MLITIILTSTLISLVCILLIRQHYQERLKWYQAACRGQQQTIFFQFQRIEELEIEREMLHEVAVKGLALPEIEDYYQVSGLEVTVNRN